MCSLVVRSGQPASSRVPAITSAAAKNLLRIRNLFPTRKRKNYDDGRGNKSFTAINPRAGKKTRTHPEFRCRFAVIQLRQNKLGTHTGWRQMLSILREARVAARLNCPFWDVETQARQHEENFLIAKLPWYFFREFRAGRRRARLRRQGVRGRTSAREFDGCVRYQCG